MGDGVLRRVFRRKRPRAAPKGPRGLSLVAIGDVHGEVELLRDLLGRIETALSSQDPTPQRLIFLGDYVDRGAHSKETIDLLLETAAFRDCVFLRGNHDQMMLNFTEDAEIGPAWAELGGRETLASYGVRPEGPRDAVDWEETRREFLSKLPQSHAAFLKNTCYTLAEGDFLFVHAGVAPERDLDDQDPQDLMGIRSPFLECERDLGKVIVHGHTPEERPSVRHNRIGIDTGAYLSGRLTALLIRGSEVALISTRP